MAVSRKAMTEGIRTSLFPGTFNIYNPSVSHLRETAMTAPLGQQGEPLRFAISSRNYWGIATGNYWAAQSTSASFGRSQ